MKNMFRWNAKYFSFVSILFTVLSLSLLVLTCPGWSVGQNFTMLVWAGGLLLVISIIKWVSLDRGKFDQVSIKTIILLAAIILIILAIGFNYGDCGGAGGGYSFFQRLTGPTGCKSALGQFGKPLSFGLKLGFVVLWANLIISAKGLSEEPLLGEKIIS